MKSLSLVLILFTAFVLSSCNKDTTTATTQPTRTPQSSPTLDQFAEVRQIYAKDCAVCHGDTGEGKTATVEGKRIKAPSLRTGHALTHPDQDFSDQIVKGGDGMPAFKDKLKQQQIDDMVRFIRKEFQGK